MKLQKISAHIVQIENTNYQNSLLDDNGKYIRIGKDKWYYYSNSGEIEGRVYHYQSKDLEKEFQETVNVIHEQLPLL